MEKITLTLYFKIMGINKKFLLALPATALLASCSDSDVFVNEPTSVETGMGKLVRAGLIAGTHVENETRALSAKGHFVWMPTELNASDGSIISNSNQRIGFCWTGVDLSDDAHGALTQAGKDVYTNYEFEHVGWLDADPRVKNVDFDECTGKLNNGAYIVGMGSPVAKWDAVPSSLTEPRYAVSGKSYYDDDTTRPLGSYNGGSKNLGLNKGIFQTENKSIFQGQYLVYYPYTNMFTKGPVIANEPTDFPNVVMNSAVADRFATYSQYGFCMGVLDKYEGGTRSVGFESAAFASYANIRIANTRTDRQTYLGSYVKADDRSIEKVILYSPSSQIWDKRGINASEAIAGHWSEDVIYTPSDADHQTSTIFASVNDGTNAYTVIAGGEGTSANYSNVSNRVVLPVLPQTVNDLKVIVIYADGKSSEWNIGTKKFEAGANAQIDINLWEKAAENTYYAVDEPSFAKAADRIHATADGNGTIKILNNINLETVNDAKYAAAQTVSYNGVLNINADASNTTAGLVVKSGTTRYFEADATSTYLHPVELNVNVPVIVEGYGCCSEKVAVLNLGGNEGSHVDIINMKKLTNYGITNVGCSVDPTVDPATYPINATAGSVEVTIDDVENLFDDEYVKGQKSVNGRNYTKGSKLRGKVANAAKLNISSDAASTVKVTNNLTNEGVVTMLSNNTGSSRNLTVNLNEVINNGNLAATKNEAASASDVIGGQITVSEHVYVKATNFKNNGEVASIKIAGVGNSETTDGRVDVAQAGQSENTGTIDNRGVLNLLRGSLDNQNGLFIDRQTGQVGGIRVQNGDEKITQLYYDGIHQPENMYETDLNTGIYVAQVETKERMAKVLSDAVIYPSTVIVEIINNGSTKYNLSEYANDLFMKDVRINTQNASDVITFEAMTSTNKWEDKGFGCCVDVVKGKVVVTNGLLKTRRKVVVRKDMTFTATKTLDSTTPTPVAATLTVGTDMILEKTTVTTTATSDMKTTIGHDLIVGEDVNATFSEVTTVGNDVITAGTVNTTKDLTVGHNVDVKNTGTFYAKGDKYYVKGSVITAGTFKSESSNNTIDVNFTENAGVATFAAQTTTTIKGQFDCFGGQFERLAISGGLYRATVNCGVLGATDEYGGYTNSAWPTQM